MERYLLLIIIAASTHVWSADELLLYDWNKVATRGDSGFLYERPPRENGDWTAPVDYTKGTIHIRAEVRDIPTEKSMTLRLFYWQNGGIEAGAGPKSGLKFTARPGTTTIATGTLLFKKGGRDGMVYYGGTLDWSAPRRRAGCIVCNAGGSGKVSGKSNFNWAGQDPDDWYPMDLRFTAVLVPEGQTFSGWHNYVDTAVPETTRTIRMNNLPDWLWTRSPDAAGEDVGGTTVFSDLDPSADHVIEATRGGNG